MITITTTHKIQAVLAGAVSASQPHYWTDYIDTADDAVGQGNGTLNDTTDVDIVAAPSSGDRLVKQIHVYNADTASVTVTVKTDAGGTERILRKATLTTGQSLVYNSSSGWYIDSIASSGGGAVSSVFARTGAVVAANGDYTASQITNTPAGGIAATTVQAAIDELDSEKSGTGHTHSYQASDATLTALAGLGSGADKLPYFTGVDTAAEVTLTAAGRALVDDADASAQRTTLGLGTAATQSIASASGAWDFGGATSVEVPNGAGGTTVDAAGEVCVDTTSRTVNFHDGTAEVVLNPLRTFAMLILAPVATDDLPIFRFEAAATVVKTVYAITGGTNWVGQVQEANDAQGTSAADTQAADSTVTGTTTVTSYSNASFDAGDYAFLKTTSVSGSVTWLHVQVWYRENA